MTGFSSPEQLERLQEIIRAYWRLPEVVRGKHIPGGFLERAVARIHDGKTSGMYDFIDVAGVSNDVGWQVKSTKVSTPITWKRAKISNKLELIARSESSDEEERLVGLQSLGDAVIDYCNESITSSFKKYENIEVVNYSRLIHHKDNTVRYFERELCTRNNPTLFEKRDFTWHWRKTEEPELLKIDDSTPQKRQKEYALYGTHVPTNAKWWAWHGRSENQLHFVGERVWWPDEASGYAFTMALPSDDEVMSLDDLLELVLKSGS